MSKKTASGLTIFVLILSSFISVFLTNTPATSAATITDLSVVPDSKTLSATTTYTITFTATQNISGTGGGTPGQQGPNGSPIIVNFWYNGEPSNGTQFDLSSASLGSGSGTVVGTVQEMQQSDANAPVGVNVFSSNDIAAGTTVKIILENVVNPSQKGQYSVQVMVGAGPNGSGDTGTVKLLLGVGETVTLTGQVTYSGTSTPVTDAAVNAFPRTREGGEGLFLNTNVDSNGNYSLEIPKSGTFEVRVEPQWSNNGQQVAVDWAFTGMGQVVDTTTYSGSAIDLTVVKATATVSGKVVKPDGSVAGGGWVDIRSKSGAGVGGGISPNDGTFSISVPAGSYRINLFVDDQSLAAPAIAPFSISDDETKDFGTITLVQKTSKISGKVVDKDTGAGIADVRVNTWSPEAGGWAETTSASDGSYTLTVGAGTWEVMVEPGPDSGYAFEAGPPTRITVAKDETKSNVDFKLTRADNTVNGTVVDVNGNQVTNFFGFAMAMEGTGDPPKPGPGGPAEGGTFSLALPDGTWTINVETEPGSDYSSAGGQTISVSGGETKTVSIIMKQNDATISGVVKDDDGNAVTGVRAEVFAENGRGSFKIAEVDPADGSYTMGVVGGNSWYFGVFVEPNSGYVMLPPSDNKTTVKSGDSVTKNFTLLKSNATISGKVTDPNGNGLSGVFVFADTNMVEDGNVLGAKVVRGEEKVGGPVGAPKADMGPGVHTGDLTDANGNFTLQVPAGTYGVGSGAPASLGYINPEFKEVTVAKDGTATISLQYRAADATISGTVTLDGVDNQGFVWAWSEKGAHSETFTRTGSYTLNVTKGDTWHIGVDYEGEQKFYQSQEYIIDLSSGTTTEVTQDLSLTESSFTLPTAVSRTIDAAQGGTIQLDNGLRLVIPAGAFGSSGSYTVTLTPTAQLAKEKSRKPIAFGYKISAVDSNGQTLTSTFNSNVRLVIPYTDEMLTAMGLTEDDLSASFFDNTSSVWQGVDSFTVDTDNNTVIASISHFTNFALTAGSNGSASVVPTPTPTLTPTPTSTPTPTPTPATSASASLPSTGVPITEAISFYLARLLGIVGLTAPMYIALRRK